MNRSGRVNRRLFLNECAGLFGADLSHREIFYFMGMIFGDLDRAVSARFIAFLDEAYLDEAKGCLPERFGGRLVETQELSKRFKRYERKIRKELGPTGVAKMRTRLISEGIIVDSDGRAPQG